MRVNAAQTSEQSDRRVRFGSEAAAAGRKSTKLRRESGAKCSNASLFLIRNGAQLTLTQDPLIHVLATAVTGAPAAPLLSAGRF